MATALQTYEVISHTPIVIQNGNLAISYQPGQIFTASPRLPSIIQLLLIGSIIVSNGGSSTGQVLIADSQLANLYIFANGSRAFTGSQSLGGNALNNVLDPVNAQDAATKNYVDTHGGGGAATQLATTGSPVTINTASPPSSGEVLVATSSTAATWQAAFIRADGTVALTADWNVGGFHLLNLLDPTTAQGAATKHYVDTRLSVVQSYTSSTALSSANANQIATNTGASGTVILTLPAMVVGLELVFAVTAAFTLQINNFNSSTTINLGITTGSAGGNVSSNNVGSMLRITGVSSTQWFGEIVTGSWDYT
jgi:hypothetical protein